MMDRRDNRFCKCQAGGRVEVVAMAGRHDIHLKVVCSAPGNPKAPLVLRERGDVPGSVAHKLLGCHVEIVTVE
jgi:hypothetical protein